MALNLEESSCSAFTSWVSLGELLSHSEPQVFLINKAKHFNVYVIETMCRLNERKCVYIS